MSNQTDSQSTAVSVIPETEQKTTNTKVNSSISNNTSTNSSSTPNSTTIVNDKAYLEKFKAYINNKKVDNGTSATSVTKLSVRGIGNILDAMLAKGMIASEEYNVIKFEAVNTGKTFSQILVEKGIITGRDLVKLTAETKGIEFIDVRKLVITDSDLNLLPSNIASTAVAIVIESTPYKVKVVMQDPLDLQKIKYLESIIGKKVDSVFGYVDDIKNIIDTKYGAQMGSEVTDALEEIGTVDLKNYDQSDIKADDTNAPIIRIVNMILDYGIKNKASDVHIEPREKKIVVRFRIRGILYEKLSLPLELVLSITIRIKILFSLKIYEHRITIEVRL